MLQTQKHVILELNTRVWLQSLNHGGESPLSLEQVPDSALDHIAGTGASYLWLMGVWTRSPQGREQALALLPQLREALPDIAAADVIASPYAVYDWQVAPELGGREALADLRRRLRQRGIGLILDYVSNHVARDHRWLHCHPDWFIQGGERDLQERPGDFFASQTHAGRRIFAHGRDPWFPGWTDTAQVNAFNPEYREAVRQVLFDLAAQCDGLRCDMAMLLCNGVFAATWRDQGDLMDTMPTEFWQELISALREQFPDFLFIAEVYWDMEADLLRLGFDYCYDKPLYDALLHCDASRLRAMLSAPVAHQNRLLRFTENHDERRAVTAFGEARSRTAFTLAATLPGGLLLHDGQLEGRSIHTPVQLARQPEEASLPEHEDYQRRVLRELGTAPFRQGKWQHFETLPPVDGHDRPDDLFAYGWASPGDWRLVIINLGAYPAWGRVPLTAWPEIATGNWRLEDCIDGACYDRDGVRMTREGLEIQLPARGAHLFRLQPA